uniref:Uncharacterized protein n=1 Tax=Hucho hucho TaxID=62062 RepID=A0A4W5R975_9TELE
MCLSVGYCCGSPPNLACVFPPSMAPPAAHPRTLQWDTDPSVLQLQDDSELGRRMHRLGPSKITQVDFLPREVVSYCKETQTPIAGTTHLSEGECVRCACGRVCEYFIIYITQHYRALDCSLFTTY